MPPNIHFVAVPEEESVDWHFGHLLTYRLLAFLPSIRQRMLDDEAGRRAAKDAPAPPERARAS
jgi:hypothetical protein